MGGMQQATIEIGPLLESELNQAAQLYVDAFPQMVRQWYTDPQKGFWLYRDWLKLVWKSGAESFFAARTTQGLAGYLLLVEPGVNLRSALIGTGMWREIGARALSGQYGLPLRALGRAIKVLVGWPLSPLEAGMADSPLVEILVVRPEYAGKGIGSLLLSRAREFSSAQYARIWLHVRRDNPGAMAFYQRHGFRVIGSDRKRHLMQIDLVKAE